MNDVCKRRLVTDTCILINSCRSRIVRVVSITVYDYYACLFRVEGERDVEKCGERDIHMEKEGERVVRTKLIAK